MKLQWVTDSVKFSACREDIHSVGKQGSFETEEKNVKNKMDKNICVVEKYVKRHFTFSSTISK